MADFVVAGNIVDVVGGRVFPGRVEVRDGKVAAVAEDGGRYGSYVMPGFVDSHVHIESSMLVPGEFARLATVHGTVGTVSDPHEIANVLGVEGVRYMAEAVLGVPFKFHWGAPACVPATRFETAGACVTAREIGGLLEGGVCHYLSEVMNFPAVLAREPEMMEKLGVARRLGKPIDGHAPWMRGEAVGRYFHAETGIATDHECTELEEGLEKIAAGAKILIREGSAAKNFAALWPLLKSHPERVMLCSDDKHPDDLLAGHINALVTRALKLGVPLMNVLRAASMNAVVHYGLPVGLLRVGDAADFIEVDSLEDFGGGHVLRTFVDGRLVAERGRGLIERRDVRVVNRFESQPCAAENFEIHVEAGRVGNRVRVIGVEDGQLITRERMAAAARMNSQVLADVDQDVLKIAVLSRYGGGGGGKPAVGFIQGFGMKRGAIASSVAHDSHNVVAVGTSDEMLARAVNAVVQNRGGLAVVSDAREETLALPVAGLMSCDAGEVVGARYGKLQRMAVEELGCGLKSPFMTLSFMALLVIPELKLSDQGLFDGGRFGFVDVCVE